MGNKSVKPNALNAKYAKAFDECMLSKNGMRLEYLPSYRTYPEEGGLAGVTIQSLWNAKALVHVYGLPNRVILLGTGGASMVVLQWIDSDAERCNWEAYARHDLEQANQSEAKNNNKIEEETSNEIVNAPSVYFECCLSGFCWNNQNQGSSGLAWLFERILHFSPPWDLSVPNTIPDTHERHVILERRRQRSPSLPKSNVRGPWTIAFSDVSPHFIVPKLKHVA